MRFQGAKCCRFSLSTYLGGEKIHVQVRSKSNPGRCEQVHSFSDSLDLCGLVLECTGAMILMSTTFCFSDLTLSSGILFVLAKSKQNGEEGGTDDARLLTDGDPWIEDGQTNELWYCWSRSFCKTGKDKEKCLIWLNLD